MVASLYQAFLQVGQAWIDESGLLGRAERFESHEVDVVLFPGLAASQQRGQDAEASGGRLVISATLGHLRTEVEPPFGESDGRLGEPKP